MDLTRKTWFVAGGHLTETPASIMHSRVVRRDSVWLAFLIAALNNLKIIACDVGNAFLNARSMPQEGLVCRRPGFWIAAGYGCQDCQSLMPVEIERGLLARNV